MVRIEAVEPERWSDADWKRCYELHCTAHREQGSHPRSLAAYRLAHAAVPGVLPKRYWIARDGSTAIVGKVDLALADSAPDGAALALYVTPKARSRGVARALLRHMLPIAEQQAARTVHAGAVQPVSWSICERLGGQIEHTTLQQTLILEAANWQLARAWCDNLQHARSTRLVSFENLPEELVAPFLDLQQRSWTGRPRVLIQASAAPTLALRREEERRHQLLGWRWLTLAACEQDGTLRAATDVSYDPLQPELVRQNLTAVLPDHRGGGLAKWLKAAILLSIRQHFPAAKRLLTANGADNTAILEINRKLGFDGAIQQRLYTFELALLRARLGIAQSALARQS